MIASRCFELEWIEAKRRELRAADPGILEKAIHALALLSALVRSDCDLVFKGGTALLLHLPEFRRLSIDIDIVCSESKAEFERRLDSIIPLGPFTRWEEHVRGDRGLPRRRHYKFHYPSPTQRGGEELVLLDVVEEANVIADLVEKPIAASFIECEEEILVQLPSVEALLADKLTAYAPHTVGVPLTEKFSQQVIKQIFDVGQLYDHAGNLSVIRRASRAVFEAEATYRKEFHGGYGDYLEDVTETSMWIGCLTMEHPPVGAPADLELLKRGVRQMGNHLVGPGFGMREAGVASAKAAWLAGALGSVRDADFSLPRWNPADPETIRELRQAALHPRFSAIESLKRLNPEAYFYWVSQL